ncbi:hypothetical protein JCGZ_00041 [Jatropha curcas]|uniref:Uncharacterized protein n=1 Tax=Jatropha curcas TaxID=180498 RepID=A0A067LQD9_JATCU|nr:GDSL esterase/lipase At5g55050 [Jatropha curcas]KDP47150.1 hypothetical protein JCGZ_00041 [Jatropha curcas]
MGKKIFVLIFCIAIVAALDTANAEVPAVFILGDSTADTGTNNFLSGSIFKANFLPYGIDFPHSRPTGRFSNGFNSADFLAKFLGFKRSPLPFFLVNNIKGVKRPSFRGVNFASAGSGILNITGQPPNATQNVISLAEQIDQFSSIYSELVANKGEACAQTFLSKSLFFISVGSNDLFAYFLSNTSVPNKQEFIDSLGLAYDGYLRNLYKLGARKFGIISVPTIGCCPSMRILNFTGGCLGDLNTLATDFYTAISVVLVKLSSEYKDIKYSLGDTYEMTINVIDNPSLSGFTNVKDPCCEDENKSCSPNANFCSDRRQYLFWDLYHPTQKASWLAAVTLFTGDARFVTPINIKQLAEA